MEVLRIESKTGSHFQCALHLQVFLNEHSCYSYDTNTESIKYISWKQAMLPPTEVKPLSGLYFRLKCHLSGSFLLEIIKDWQKSINWRGCHFLLYPFAKGKYNKIMALNKPFCSQAQPPVWTAISTDMHTQRRCGPSTTTVGPSSTVASTAPKSWNDEYNIHLIA